MANTLFYYLSISCLCPILFKNVITSIIFEKKYLINLFFSIFSQFQEFSLIHSYIFFYLQIIGITN